MTSFTHSYRPLCAGKELRPSSYDSPSSMQGRADIKSSLRAAMSQPTSHAMQRTMMFCFRNKKQHSNSMLVVLSAS